MNRPKNIFRRLMSTAIVIAALPAVSRAAVDTDAAARELAPERAPAVDRPAPDSALTTVLPAPGTLRVYDRPSDDGSTVILEWEATVKSPEKEEQVTDAVHINDAPVFLRYVVEVAKSPEDFEDNTYRVLPVRPVPGALKSANNKYCGFSKDNTARYHAEISPAKVFQDRDRGPYHEPLQLFIEKGITSAEALNRALIAAERDKPEDELSVEERELREWFSRLNSYRPLVENIEDLVEAGVLDDGDREDVLAAMRDRRLPGDEDFYATDAAERKWLERLVKNIPVALQLDELQEEGILTGDDVDDVVAAIRNRKTNEQLSGMALEDRNWVIRLGGYLDLVAAMPKLIEKGIVEDSHKALIGEVIRNRKSEEDLGDTMLAARDWVNRLKIHMSVALNLDTLVQNDILTENGRDYAITILRRKKSNEHLTERDEADLAWIKRLGNNCQFFMKLAGHVAWMAEKENPDTASSESKLAPDSKTVDGEDNNWLKMLAEFLGEDPTAGVVAAVRNRKSRTQLSWDERGDRRWFKIVKAHVAGKINDQKERVNDTVNSAPCYFRIAVAGGGKYEYVEQDSRPVVVASDGAKVDYFKMFKLNGLIFALLFSAAVMVFIYVARNNQNLFIRRIPGLEAVEEAIGRATEMGRSVFYIPGIEYMEHRATIASMNILSRVAKQTAEYDTRIQVMNMDPVVTAVSQEVVQQAYTEAGRPDAFDPDDITLSAFDQFSYVAAVAGRMVREQPAAIFLMGHFYAESLLLAETGAATGAIQVAGTDAFTQLPFFVTTCDYTLIGEELFAASAYLSREPKLLGSLRGQDIGKALLMLTIIVGAIVMTLGMYLGWHLGWIRWVVTSFS